MTQKAEAEELAEFQKNFSLVHKKFAFYGFLSEYN